MRKQWRSALTYFFDTKNDLCESCKVRAQRALRDIRDMNV